MVEAFGYMFVLGFGGSMGVLLTVFIGLKIYNRKGKQPKQRDIIG
ncbi:hypothetical protein [Bacillus cereus]|nr:hypothetical protein [Bacillus cereus]EEL73248.1 hypothetical protein bcere0027_54810 [Bacillus cereus AH676]